ncbi:MAG: RNA polymerase sigma factor [Bradymonadaceae bacterium]
MQSINYHAPCDERSSADDAELVERIRSGESSAFDQLICRYSEQFYRLARSIVEDESEAEDVLQRAFLKIHRKLDTLRKVSSFRSWAYRIVRNMALMRVREQSRSDEIGFGDLGPGRDDERHFETEAPDWRHRADEAVKVSELRDELAEAIRELRPKYQSAFLLHEIEGMSLSEMGELLDLTVAGVKSRVHRARKHLRATLRRYASDELDAIE